jgi:hypothetical protein
MPSWTSKDQRQYEHIKDGLRPSGSGDARTSLASASVRARHRAFPEAIRDPLCPLAGPVGLALTQRAPRAGDEEALRGRQRFTVMPAQLLGAAIASAIRWVSPYMDS